MVQDNDLISRAAAIRAVHEEFDECLVWDESGEATANAVESVLYRVQSVDAAPMRHGRWIKETDRENHWHCSECGVVVGIVAEYSPYCYKCGAKMATEISNIPGKKFVPSLDDVIKEFNAKWTISGAKMDGGDCGETD